MGRTTFVTLAVAILVAVSGKTQTSSLAALKTTAEASDFKSTSSYEDVVRFMKAAAAASPNVRYLTYGRTFENREMPLAVVGTGLRDASPESVKASGKLRVHIQGNIHAGEVEGKESAQILLRDLATGRHDDWLQSTIFLITPIFNADGNERMSLTSRLPQNGPIHGQGTRSNAQNLNINRDFTKLDTPEARAFAKLWIDYDPHVGIDLHTSDGSFHAYHLTYSPPLNPDTSTSIVRLMTDEWLPFVTRNIKSQSGSETFYYGNASDLGVAASPRRAWMTFSHLPRYHNNYVGLRNRFALLSEAYSYLTFEDRIKATNAFLEQGLTFAHQTAMRLKRVCEDADRESIIGKSEATHADYSRGAPVSILMGEVESEKNPIDGSNMYRRKAVSRVEPMLDMMWFQPAVTEEVPSEYYVPAVAAKSVTLLRAHGIQLRQLTSPISGLEQFAISTNTVRPANTSPDFGAHAVRALQGVWQPAPAIVAPAGAWAVPMNQPLARLAFYLLAPTSDDGLVYWNYLDEELRDTRTYPILRRR